MKRLTIAMRCDPAVKRFLAKFVVADNGCWEWRAGKDRDGYAKFSGGKERSAHRWIYALLAGPIPARFQVDHMCHDPNVCHLGSDCPHRSCVNPKHLSAVAPRDNIMRSSGVAAANAAKATCKQGHPFNAANTHITRAGRRKCRACNVEWNRAAVVRKRGAYLFDRDVVESLARKGRAA